MIDQLEEERRRDKELIEDMKDEVEIYKQQNRSYQNSINLQLQPNKRLNNRVAQEKARADYIEANYESLIREKQTLTDQLSEAQSEVKTLRELSVNQRDQVVAYEKQTS